MTNTNLTQYLSTNAVSENIRSVLGEGREDFVTSIISLVNANPKLQEVDHKSLINACLVSTSLHLPINSNFGFAHIIPYKNKQTGLVEAQFQMGYKGFIQLAVRSGQFETINVTDVREGEIVEINRLSGEIKFDWLVTDREQAAVVGFVAYFKLLSGFKKSLYMTVKELNAHGVRYSQSMKRGYGLWKDDFDAMAKKTVLKLLLSRFAPLNSSTELLSRAGLADQAVVDAEDTFRYVDNQPVDATEVALEKEKTRVLRHISEASTMDELKQVKDHLADEETRKAYDSQLENIEIAESLG